MASNEDQLNDLVNGGLWGMPNFSSLIKSVEDDYEENLPHPSARAGKRGDHGVTQNL